MGKYYTKMILHRKIKVVEKYYTGANISGKYNTGMFLRGKIKGGKNITHT